MKLENVLALNLQEGDPVEIKNSHHNTHFEFLAYFAGIEQGDSPTLGWYDEKGDIGKGLYKKSNDLKDVAWIKRLERKS